MVDLRVDIGLVLAPTRDSATLSTDLCAADLVCLLPAGHDLAQLDVVRPRDLEGLPLITYSRIQPIGELIEAEFERSGSRRMLGIEITQSAAACAMVNAGAGVALVDAFALIATQYPNIVVRPFRPRIAVRGRLLQARMRPLSRLGSVFVTDLETVIRERLGDDPAFQLEDRSPSGPSHPFH